MKATTNSAPSKASLSWAAQVHAFDERVRKRNAAAHERLCMAIVESVQFDRHIEWEIVSRYLKREGYVLLPKGMADEMDRKAIARYRALSRPR